MAEGFVCRCQSKGCLGVIRGAAYLTVNQLSSYRLSPHIRRLGGGCDSFDARAYLEEYFLDVNEEYKGLYRFWAKAIGRLESGCVGLELGVGPTLYSALPLAAKCERIDLADYVVASFSETKKWLDRHPLAFNWNHHTRLVLEVEGQEATDTAVILREDRLRSQVRDLLHCDLRQENPLVPLNRDYDVVTAHYCTEAASANYGEWSTLIANCLSLLKPGGLFLLSVSTELKRFRKYDDDALKSSPDISAAVVRDTLLAFGCEASSMLIEFLPAPADRPYNGTVLVAANKGVLI